MAIVLIWHHIHIHFAQLHALQIVDGPHIVVYRNHPFRPTINVNGRDAIEVQNIRQHHLNNLMEIVDRPMAHWPMHDVMVPDIMLAQNLFAIFEIIPKKNELKLNLIFIYVKFAIDL